MSEDLDDGLGIDLEAWSSPLPPVGIADAVITRMHQELEPPQRVEGVAAVEMERRGGTRVWIAGVAAIAAIAGTVALVTVGTVPVRDTAELETRIAALEAERATLRAQLDAEPGKIAALEAELAASQTERATLRAQLDAQDLAGDPALGSEANERPAGRMNPFASPPRPPRPATALPDVLDRASIDRTIRALGSKLRGCAKGFAGKLEVHLEVAPDGGVARASVSPAKAPPRACVEATLRSAKFAATNRGADVRYPLVFSTPTVDPAARSCDADPDALYDAAVKAFGDAKPAVALAKFDELYRCRAEPQTAKLAFASACKAKNLTKAREYWRAMSVSARESVVAICVYNGILPEALEATLGRLQVYNKLPAKVLIDGRERGTTPLDLMLPPGRHKVTLTIDAGGDRVAITGTVHVKVGETVTLRKDLE